MRECETLNINKEKGKQKKIVENKTTLRYWKKKSIAQTNKFKCKKYESTLTYH